MSILDRRIARLEAGARLQADNAAPIIFWGDRPEPTDTGARPRPAGVVLWGWGAVGAAEDAGE